MLVMGGYWALYLLFYPLSPLVLVVTNFWLPVCITLLILYIPLDKSFHIEENIKKIREDQMRGGDAAQEDARSSPKPDRTSKSPGLYTGRGIFCAPSITDGMDLSRFYE